MSTSGGGAAPRGISLSNTVHSEVAPCLPLPSLPVLCGATDQELRLVDGRRSSRSLDRTDVLNQASKIADLLANTDVSYLNLKAEAARGPCGFEDPPVLCNEVLRCNVGAFEFTSPGVKEQVYNTISERKPSDQTITFAGQAERGSAEPQTYQADQALANETLMSSSGKPKPKKKASNSNRSATAQDPIELQESAIKSFCEFVEEFSGRAEIPNDDQDDSEWLQLPLTDVRMLVDEIVSIRGKKVLHLVPVEILVSLLRVLDHQIHRAEGLSINGCSNSDSDLVSSVCGALESIHAALAIMAHNGMPKQIYKEEIIERILEFCKHQIGDILSACDPAYRALHKPIEDEIVEDEEDDDFDNEFGSANKKRRTFRGVKVKKSSVNKISVAVNIVLRKMCTILGFLKDLLTVERLSDSCILQLLKTSFTTLSVDNVELLQLKTIDLISGIFYVYMQHRHYVIDELLQLLSKLPFSKRIPRTYHLHDEEQKQIQMVTALLIQLVHCSANLPEAFRQASDWNPIIDVSIDPTYPAQCQDAITETCCHFWTGVLQRLKNTKPQDASELKAMIEHLVMDLLSTLNLPEYPGSASILEVLCVLLLQNAGPKSKDIAVRSVATDLLGTIAARLKRDSAVNRKESFWIVQELIRKDNDNNNFSNNSCAVCTDGSVEKPLFLCQGCQRYFHANCMGVLEQEVPSRGWHCQFCHCKKQLVVLQTYSNSRCKDEPAENTSSDKTAPVTGPISKMEIVQQMLLNYLQDGGSADDVHLFTRWFLLCIWIKDDPESRQKFFYYLARLKSKAIVRNSGIVSSSLTRVAVKKIALAIGLNNSFSRGFEKILHMFLGNLKENSPVIRAKALRAVSIIVEADPEVLCDEDVQQAVEGRFCDTAISVREAALELVGRHIASHPDVGSKYFEKVAERMKDTGVSVRKRAIKIIKEMCTSNANFVEFTSACIEIISRVSDDESSIQDLVCKTFHEFWFEEDPGSQSRFFGDNSSVPLEVAKKTEQIVEMLQRMTNHQLLVTVIKRNLSLDFLPQSAKAVGINPITLASVRKRCELMCKFLVERILQVEESNNGEAEVLTLPYVLLLNAFCVVDPTLCAPVSDPSQFVITLQPYLKSQTYTRPVAQLLESIIFIIDSVMPLLRKLPPNIVEELEQDLKQMILRHPFLTVVHACTKCLCSVSKVAGKGSEIIEYLVQFFSKRLDALGFNNKQIGRSLFCLGLLIRYGNSLLSRPGSSNSVDVKNSLDLFKKYLHAEDFQIKARSLQALGYILIARPGYMLERDVGKILEATLSASTDVRLKMQSLQNIFEYLLDAESQMGADADSNDIDNPAVGGGSTVPVAAGAGDTNICGGIIQSYWNSILDRCLDVNEKVRQSALKIVEVVLRQGLVHPLTCVPVLIALETDPQESNSKLAHHLLMNMNEKHAGFFETRLGDGLQKAFSFIRSMARSLGNSDPNVQSKEPDNMKEKSDNGTSTHARLGVSRIYKLIRANRNSRNKFMFSVVRKFQTPSWSDTIVPFLMYCTEILSILPFMVPDEPLYLIYTINRVIQVKAGTLEASIKSYLHSVQTNVSVGNGNGVAGNGVPFEAGSDQMIADLNGIQREEPADQAMLDHSVSENSDLHSKISSDPCAVTEDGLRKTQVDCLAATAIQLLLKLKRHLKIVYGLNDARCQEYSPSEPLKSGDAFSKQSIPFNIGDTRTDLPTTFEEVLQRYREFKVALREDTVDYSTYTANIKKRRPTPSKRGGRPSRMAVRDEDDEDDDDETWGSARRRLNNSGGKRSNGKGGR